MLSQTGPNHSKPNLNLFWHSIYFSIIALDFRFLFHLSIWSSSSWRRPSLSLSFTLEELCCRVVLSLLVFCLHNWFLLIFLRNHSALIKRSPLSSHGRASLSQQGSCDTWDNEDTANLIIEEAWEPKYINQFKTHSENKQLVTERDSTHKYLYDFWCKQVWKKIWSAARSCRDKS